MEYSLIFLSPFNLCTLGHILEMSLDLPLQVTPFLYKKNHSGIGSLGGKSTIGAYGI